MSAWFVNRSTSAGRPAAAAEWHSPGDAERAQVHRVLAEPRSQVNGGGLPRRRHGAQLLPGAVPDGGRLEARHPVDPELVRSRLAG